MGHKKAVPAVKGTALWRNEKEKNL